MSELAELELELEELELLLDVESPGPLSAAGVCEFAVFVVLEPVGASPSFVCLSAISIVVGFSRDGLLT